MNVKTAEWYLTYAVRMADRIAPTEQADQFNKALTVAKIDMDKQTPLPIAMTGVNEGACPICGGKIDWWQQRHCRYCGQALDWTEQNRRDD